MQAAGLHSSELDQDDLPALCTVLDGDRSRWPRRPPRGIRSIVRWQGHIHLRHLISVRPLEFDRGLVQLGAALRAKLGGAWTLRAALTARDRHEGSLHALEGCLEYLATLFESNLRAEFWDVNRGRICTDPRSANQHNTQLFMDYLSVFSYIHQDTARKAAMHP